MFIYSPVLVRNQLPTSVFKPQVLSVPLHGDIFAVIVSCVDKNECQNDDQTILDVHYRVISLYGSLGQRLNWRLI